MECSVKRSIEMRLPRVNFATKSIKQKFTPKLSEFILITTAPRDQKIQQSARLLTEELAKTDHPILVCVWGWEDVEENVSKYDQAWKAFDPACRIHSQKEFMKN